MTAAQDRLSGGQLQAALANESGKLVADFTSRGKVRNVGSAAPARLSRKSTHRARTPAGSSPRRHHHLRVRINHPGEHHPKLITRATVSGMISRSMNPSSRGNPHIPQPERESWPNARSAGDSTNSRAVLADAQPATIAKARQQRHQVGRDWRPERTTRDGLIEALTALSGRCLALKARNRELASEVKQLRADRRQLRSRMAARSISQPAQTTRIAQARAALAREDERRRLERDLHDGVQNELVSLIVKLSLAEQDRDTPPAPAGTFSALAAHATAVLDSLRQITHGIDPPPLAKFGVREALRAQTARAAMDVTLKGTAPRSTQEAEAAVYFSCLEAIQNIGKHSSPCPLASSTANVSGRTTAARRATNRGCGTSGRRDHDRDPASATAARPSRSGVRGAVLRPWARAPLSRACRSRGGTLTALHEAGADDRSEPRLCFANLAIHGCLS